MKTLFAILLTATIGQPALGRTVKDPLFPYPIRVERLTNGFTVALVKFPSPGLVAHYTLVRVGSRHEVEPGHTGFAHLFEHMMFRGTKKVPGGERDAITKFRGINDTAWTYIDHTVYTLEGPTSSLPTMVEIEGDRFQNLWYTKEVFQTEAKAVLGEYNKNFSNPANKMEEVISEVAFQRHTYRHTTMGFLDDIKRMPEMYEYGLGFFKRFYRPDNCTLFIVGDFDGDAALALVRAHFGSWGEKGEVPKIEREPDQNAERSKHVDWESETKPRLMLGYRAAAMRGDFRDAAIQNLLFPLLFGAASALYKELVLDKQTVESMESWYIDTIDPRLFPLLVTLKDPKQFAPVKAAIVRAIEQVAAGGLSKTFFDDVKSNARYGLLMGLTTPGKVAEKLVWFATPTGDPDSLEKLYDQIGRLTADDIAAYLKKNWTSANRTVITLATRKK